MPNPARLLHAILEEWQVPAGSSAEVVRKVASVGDPLPGWRRQGRAAMLLNDIERALGSLRVNGFDVSGYEFSLPSWYQGVYNMSIPFGTGASGVRAALNPQGMATLKMLAMQLDTSGYSSEVPEDRRKTIREALEAVLELLRDDKLLPQDEKRYVWGLVVDARDAIEQYEDIGVMTFRSRVQEAAGAVDAAAVEISRTDPQKGGKLYDLAVTAATAVVTTLVSEGTEGLASLAAAEVRKALAGG